MKDKIHPIIYRPHLYEITYVGFHTDRNDFSNSYIDIHFVKGEESKKLRFFEPTEVEVEKGFYGDNNGMEILDITDRQYDGVGIEVRNFEQDAGITFLAREVKEINN